MEVLRLWRRRGELVQGGGVARVGGGGAVVGGRVAVVAAVVVVETRAGHAERLVGGWWAAARRRRHESSRWGMRHERRSTVRRRRVWAALSGESVLEWHRVRREAEARVAGESPGVGRQEGSSGHESHLVHPLLLAAFVLEPHLDDPHWQPGLLGQLLPHQSRGLWRLAEHVLEDLQLLGLDGGPRPPALVLALVVRAALLLAVGVAVVAASALRALGVVPVLLLKLLLLLQHWLLLLRHVVTVEQFGMRKVALNSGIFIENIRR